MRQLIVCICLAVLVFVVVMSDAQEKPPLKLVGKTPMPGFTGDFDLMEFLYHGV